MSLPLLALPAALALFAPPAACPKIAEPAAGAKVAMVDGKAITRAEVDAHIADELCKARTDLARRVHEMREQAANALIDERLLAAEAKKRGLKDVEALEAQIAAGAPKIDESVARQLYEENKDRVDGQPYEALRERILASLAQESVGQARAALLAGLREKAAVSFLLEPIRTPVDASGPSRGPANAPVTIVAFGDFECPYCARGAATVEEVRRKHGDAVRIVFKDYPLGFHEKAVPAAIAARCAGQQGKFWEMHDALFAAQRELGPALYTRLAGELKLDAAKFGKCQADPALAAAVRQDTAAGEAAGVEGTPAFFINGVSLSGAQPAEAFEAIISAELSRKGGGKAAKAGR
jgi:protein-disulfide isomerase